MKKLVAIGIPVLLALSLFCGIGGRGFDAVALLLLFVGGWFIARPPTKKRLLYATIYVVGLEALFLLFS